MNVERIKERYPQGTRIRCLFMRDDYHPIPFGTMGTVDYVDDAGQIHMNWDNGSSLALVIGVDCFDVVSEEVENENQLRQRHYL